MATPEQRKAATAGLVAQMAGGGTIETPRANAPRWRTMLASTMLAVGALAPQAQAQEGPASSPSLNAPAAATPANQRSAYIQQLNRELAQDPQTAGKIAILDPTGFADKPQAMLDKTQQLLQGMIDPQTPQTEAKQRSATAITANMARRLSEAALTNQALQQSSQGRATLRNSPSFGFDTRATGYNESVIGSGSDGFNLSNPSYLSLVVPLAGNSGGGSIAHRFEDAMKPDFAAQIAAAEGGKFDILHEIAHGLRPAVPLPGETPFVTEVRSESAADAFTVLKRLQEGEPGMIGKTETLAQARIFGASMRDPEHDTSGALKLLAEDMKKDPQFAQKLAGKSMPELEALGYDYAQKALAKDYPHLADPKLDATEKLALTEAADREYVPNIRAAAGLVQDKKSHLPQDLSARSAAKMVEMADIQAEKGSQGHNNGLSKALPALRAANPDAFRDADKLRGTPETKSVSVSAVRLRGPGNFG